MVFRLLALGLMLALLVVLLVATSSGGAPPAHSQTLRTEINSPVYGVFLLDYTSPAAEQDLGLPLYPKAKATLSWRLSAKEKHNGKQAGYLARALLTTADAREKVAAFYKALLNKRGKYYSVYEISKTLFFFEKGGDTFAVEIRSSLKPNETTIELNHAGPIKAPLIENPEEGVPGEGLLI